MNEEIKLKGGHLGLAELNAIFTTIPQEFDVLDENDVVVWSSMNEHRLFPRTEKDIGKTVYEVHPGHSQGRVKAVLQQMHEGKRESISINIHKNNIPVNISFYSLHDDSGKYLGCVEVTQPTKNYQEKGSKWRNIKNMIFKK
ncbi:MULTISPECIES: PAS domain-containing protein [Lactobacillus]|uniref:PAS domain-containing protein n=1 Tax=Lactobacillus xujianguonis TaxID=2495899 RepID=A0A437SUA0_9LACO|nr:MULTISPECIES: PAS domain-containing protein [Lactobacillus]RVU70476.1 hypothetical protein EJK17_07220 [Lactobacillus xujianguonis]RVU76854.1 hypothetical protein EJK20_03485 [Lactobacillus xujianguonis]